MVTEKRRKNAEIYYNLLNRNKVFIPEQRTAEYNTFHTFVIQVENRDQLKEKLAKAGIQTGIHYPIPIHLQPASINLGYKKGDFIMTENQAGKILTLPVNQYLTNSEVMEIAYQVNTLL